VVKSGEYDFDRRRALFYSTVVALLIGLYNTFFPPVDLTLDASLLGWLLLALVSTIILHEGTHGAVARILGHKPIFGIRPPLVFVTFEELIPRWRFIAVAVAPLILLNAIFATLFTLGTLKIYCYFLVVINTLGSVGDIWIAFKLLPQKRGSLVGDTKSGIEIWHE
jgi:hypothetical protein